VNPRKSQLGKIRKLKYPTKQGDSPIDVIVYREEGTELEASEPQKARHK